MFFCAFYHRFPIHRFEGAQIQNLYLSVKGFCRIFCPMHSHSVGNDQTRFPIFYRRLICCQINTGFSQRNYIIVRRLNRFCVFAAGYFSPIQTLMLKHYHRVWVVKSSPHQTFHIRSIGRIDNFHASDGQNGGFHARRMERSSTAIRSNWHTNDGLNIPFSMR